MDSTRIFRILVIAATTCYVVWFLLPFWASDIELQVISYSGHGALLPVRNPLYYGSWFVLSIIAAVGMVYFCNWARHLYLGLSILGPVLAPFSGYLIQPPMDTLFSSANLILDGVVLGVAYLSPISKRFTK